MNIKQQYIVLYAQDGRSTLGFVKLTYQGDRAMVQAQANIRSEGEAELCLDDGTSLVRMPMQNRRTELVAAGTVSIGTGRIVAAICNSRGLQALGQSMMPKAYWHAGESMCRSARPRPMGEEAIPVSEGRVMHEKEQPKANKEAPMPVPSTVPNKVQPQVVPEQPKAKEQTMPQAEMNIPKRESPKPQMQMPEAANEQGPNMQMPEAANEQGPNMQMPEAANEQEPNMQMPEAANEQGPNMQMPEVANEQGPNMQMPEVANEQGPNMQMPEASNEQAPNMQMPEAANEQAPNVQMPEAAKKTGPNMQMPDMRMTPGDVNKTRMRTSQAPLKDTNPDAMWKTMPDAMQAYVRDCVKECMRDSMQECVQQCMREYMNGSVVEPVLYDENEPCPQPMAQMPEENDMAQEMCEEPEMNMPDMCGNALGQGQKEPNEQGGRTMGDMGQMPKHVPMLSSHSRLWSYLNDVCPSGNNGMQGNNAALENENAMDNANEPQSFTSFDTGSMPMETEAEAEIKLSVMGPYANMWHWHRVVSKEADYSYLMGEVVQDDKVVAVAVAVPGSYAPSPPANLQGFQAYRDGHWILAQNAETGDVIDI